MDVEELPHADDIWWPFAVRAALDTAAHRDTWRYDAAERLLRYDGPDGTRLRMQRLYGGRMVLWGTHPDPRRAALTSWSGIPGWATSDAVHGWLQRIGATFVLWHYRDGWDSATTGPQPDEPLALLLDNDDLPPRLLAAAAAGHATAEDLAPLLDDATDPAPALALLTAAHVDGPPAQGAVRMLLATEIQAQMRITQDRERNLPQRPAVVVRWARVAEPPPGFTFSMHQQDGGLGPALGNSPIAEQFRLTLVNVFEQLHAEEASETSGAWLFARLSFDGRNVHFERAFDGRPWWYEDDGPTLRTLAAEMRRRSREWRPAWSGLLPDEVRATGDRSPTA